MWKPSLSTTLVHLLVLYLWSSLKCFLLAIHYKHIIHPSQLSRFTANLSYITKNKIYKFIIVIDLHCSFTDTWQLPRTWHMFVMIERKFQELKHILFEFCLQICKKLDIHWEMTPKSTQKHDIQMVVILKIDIYLL